jgi:hypothetical protein
MLHDFIIGYGLYFRNNANYLAFPLIKEKRFGDLFETKNA